jgi:hypothetical protein
LVFRLFFGFQRCEFLSQFNTPAHL